jgi:hypothetical protein
LRLRCEFVLAYPSSNLALCGSLCAWVSGKLTKATDVQSPRKSTGILGSCVRDVWSLVVETRCGWVSETGRYETVTGNRHHSTPLCFVLVQSIQTYAKEKCACSCSTKKNQVFGYHCSLSPAVHVCISCVHHLDSLAIYSVTAVPTYSIVHCHKADAKRLELFSKYRKKRSGAPNWS